jgi:hypothetical protein
MPLPKPDLNPAEHGVTLGGKKFPSEAYAYDSDVSERVVKRVQSQANAILSKEEWVVIDGVDGK